MAIAVTAVCSLVGCGEKPAPAPAGGPAKVEDGAADAPAQTVALSPRSLGDAELLLFMPTSVALGRSPSPGVTSLPEVKEGELRHGALMVAARGLKPKGRIAFTISMHKAAADDSGPKPWRLFVDRDLDGDLAEERPVEAMPVTKETDLGGKKVRASGARFPTVRTALPGGGSHAYVLTAYRSEVGAMVDVRSGVALSGRVDIFGSERPVIIYDSNANARFGDLYRGPLAPADDIGIDLDGDGRIGRDEIHPLARRVYHDGQSAAVTVAEDVASLVVDELDTGSGALSRAGAPAGEDLLVQMSSPEYGLLGPLRPDRLPEGRHLFPAYGLTREEDGARWVLAGKWLTHPGHVVDIPAGGAAEVRFGPPLRADATLAFLDDNRLAKVRVTLTGSLLEDATVIGSDRKPRLGSWRVVDDAGAEHGSGRLFHGLLPGLWVAEWRAPAGLEKGRKLVFEVLPDLGPFANGFDGRTPFEHGVSTKVTLVVIGTEKGSQAEALGIMRGDEIVSYDGRQIRNEFDMSLAVRDATKKAVGTVELVVTRDGRPVRFDVKPGPIGVNVKALPGVPDSGRR